MEGLDDIVIHSKNISMEMNEFVGSYNLKTMQEH